MIMKYHRLGPIGAKANAKTLEVKNDYDLFIFTQK